MSKLSRVQSADLAVLSSDDWSSSSSGSTTSSTATVEGGGGPLEEEDPSSSFWLGDIPKHHNKHAQDGQSNSSPKSTDTAWISNSSVGLLIGEGEGEGEGKPLQQPETPLAAWVDQQALGSGWEQVRAGRVRKIIHHLRGADKHTTFRQQKLFGTLYCCRTVAFSTVFSWWNL